MKHIVIVVLGGLLVGCGGSSGGGALTAQRLESLCTELCDWDVACGKPSEATCVSDCVADSNISAHIRGDLIELQVNCLSALACDATTEQANNCVPEAMPRPAHEEYSATCRSKGAECEWSSSRITSRCQDTDYWYYTDDVMRDFTDCFSEGCNAIPACILAASRNYEFEERW